MSIRVVGDLQLVADLQRLVRDITDDLETIVLEAVQPVVEEARSRSPRQSGDMADSIEAVTLEAKNNSVEIGVGPDDKYFYSIYAEMGTRSHPVRPSSRKAIEVAPGTARAGAEHPGTGGRPFLRPALDENEDVVVSGIADGLNRLLL